MSLIIVRYSEDFGRHGGLEDLFVTTDLELRALKLWGKCYRGEVLGKHSQVTSRLNDETLTVLTDDQHFIKRAVGYGIVARFNPFAERIAEEVFGDPDTYLPRVTLGMSPEEVSELCKRWGLPTDEQEV